MMCVPLNVYLTNRRWTDWVPLNSETFLLKVFKDFSGGKLKKLK